MGGKKIVGKQMTGVHQEICIRLRSVSLLCSGLRLFVQVMPLKKKKKKITKTSREEKDAI
jgi:hypothetical protein